MKISIHLTPGSKVNRVVKTDNAHYRVWVKDVPVDGRANRALIRVIAGHLKVKPSAISIVFGHTSRDKLLEIVY